MIVNDLWRLILINRPKPAVPSIRGISDRTHSIRVMACLTKCNWSKLVGHLIMKCKRALIYDGGITRPTLTLAPMGMVAPWRCQEPQTSGRVAQCFQPLGDGVIIYSFDTSSDSFSNCRFDWKLDTNLTQTNSILDRKWIDKNTLTNLKTTNLHLQNYSLHREPQTEDERSVHTCDKIRIKRYVQWWRQE